MEHTNRTIRPFDPAGPGGSSDIYLNAYPAYKNAGRSVPEHYREKHRLELWRTVRCRRWACLKGTYHCHHEADPFSMNCLAGCRRPGGLMALGGTPSIKKEGGGAGDGPLLRVTTPAATALR